MEMGFTINCPLTRLRMLLIRFLYMGARFDKVLA